MLRRLGYAAAVISVVLMAWADLAGAATTTTTTPTDPPAIELQAAGDSIAPGLMAMAAGMLALPIVGVGVRRVYNTVKGNR